MKELIDFSEERACATPGCKGTIMLRSVRHKSHSIMTDYPYDPKLMNAGDSTIRILIFGCPECGSRFSIERPAVVGGGR